MFFNRNKKINISYGITVCNEAIELKTLLDTLIPLIDSEDEIIVLQDITNVDEATSGVIASYGGKIIVVKAKLNSDFSTFKNTLISNASGNYLFQIDADEVPKTSLISNIKKTISEQRKADCFLVPRINIVNGLTDAHIDKWKWKVDDNGRVNFPDYQHRLFKLNGKIRWRYKVHEELFGFRRSYLLPVENDDFCLLHIKTIEKQSKQNQFYDQLEK